MANQPNYACTRCGNACSRKQLTVKKVLFTTMGEGARTKKARVIEWLCPSCRETDEDFLRPPFVTPRGVTQVAV